MFDLAKAVLGEKTFEFMEETVPQLIGLLIRPNFLRLFFEILFHVFEYREGQEMSLGEMVLNDKDNVSKLKTIEKGIIEILRGIDAGNIDKKDLADKDI